MKAMRGPELHRIRAGAFSMHKPPYANLLDYPETAGQLGNIASYEMFLDELDKVWAECLRILVPGGRVACIVGDVCISRRKGGRHHVLPLAGDIQVRARRIGFDNLTPIRWLKVANIRMEASRSSRFLGKPNLPNGVVKNDVETILFFESLEDTGNPRNGRNRILLFRRTTMRNGFSLYGLMCRAK